MRQPSISRRTALLTALAAGPVLAAGSRGAWAMTPDAPAAADIGPAATLTSEDGRKVQVWIWPAAAPQRGVILFSHGALSAPDKYLRLIVPWTQAGFKVLAPLHIDSTDHPDHARYTMKDSWAARLYDMRALSRFADAPAYVAAGHSYGALVALTLGGAEPIPPAGWTGGSLRDPRAACSVAFSPPGPAPTLITSQGYGHLAVPAFIETGDQDIPYGVKDGDWRVHLAAYDAAPPGDKYALVLPGVNHYFGGLICRLDFPGPPQTAQLDRATALSVDFLEAFGAGDATARGRLDAEVTPGDDGVGLHRKDRATRVAPEAG